jgi:DNA-binding MarR family transcriptional regulator
MDGFGDAFEWSGVQASGASPGDGGGRLARTRDEESDALARIDPLPAAELLAAARRMAKARRFRDEVFGNGQFLNPGWNILLELFIAGEEGRNVTIKSACVAACVPQSTALRHIAHLIDVRLATRAQHPSDARSAYLKLTDRGRTRMVAFLTLSEGGRGGSGA